jgi:hypothetical protein
MERRSSTDRIRSDLPLTRDMHLRTLFSLLIAPLWESTRHLSCPASNSCSHQFIVCNVLRCPAHVSPPHSISSSSELVRTPVRLQMRGNNLSTLYLSILVSSPHESLAICTVAPVVFVIRAKCAHHRRHARCVRIYRQTPVPLTGPD